MFTINCTNETGSKVVKDEQTIEDARRFCREWAEGREMTTEDEDGWCRLEIYEVIEDGRLNLVETTGCYKE